MSSYLLQHFKHLKRRGVYVDIAANEPVAISNTYFFDVCLQWRGLCVEANKQYVDLLKQHRSCAITSACVGDTAGNATYYLGGGYSGVRGTNKNWAAHGKNLNETHLIDVQCVPTADALAAAGVNVIDLLSLDVEGHEYKVLRGIDWGQTRVNVIVIETLSLETQELLHDIGYKRGLQPVLNHELKKKGNLYRDYVYLHPDVVWGKPI